MASSFYHVIDSESNKSTHSDNHVGAFTVELHEELLLAGNWEVALAERTYYGQHFPNVLQEYGEINISREENLYSTDFVVEYAQVFDMKIETFIRAMNAEHWFSHRYFQFEQRHYTWNQFKYMFNHWKLIAQKDAWLPYEISLTLTDTELIISLPESYDLCFDLCISFHEPLVKLLSLTTNEFYLNHVQTHNKITTSIKPPKIIHDVS